MSLKDLCVKLSSLKITVVCLLALAALTLWGTIYQVEHGLYAAQERFFNSFLIYGLIPSARLVMWLLFINLVAALITRFTYSWKKIGLVIIHLGLLVLLVSGFVTLNFSKESFVQLVEGERSNLSQDYYEWELVLAQQSVAKSVVHRLTHEEFRRGKRVDFDDFIIEITAYHPNARFFDTPFAGRILKDLPRDKNEESNTPALKFTLQDAETSEAVVLQGETDSTKSIKLGTKDILARLKRKTYKLPISLELLDVERQLHSGTEMAKAYKSKVIMLDTEHKLERELTIQMNKPLRHEAYTFYQASYGMDEDGREFSVFAVVENYGRLLPYISSLLISLGLFWHFIAIFVRYLGARAVLVLLLSLVSFAPVSAEGLKLEEFNKIAVQDQGRIKPIETLAKSVLMRFGGKSRVGAYSSSEWFAALIFDSDRVAAEKVFLINNPEVLEALGVEPDAHRKYSYAQLKPKTEKIHELAMQATQIPEEDRAAIEKEFIRLYSNFHLYLQMTDSLQPLVPDEDFKISAAGVAHKLGLKPADNSLLDTVRSSRLISDYLQLHKQEGEVFDLALHLYAWIEGHKIYMQNFGQDLALNIIPQEGELQSVWQTVINSPEATELELLSFVFEMRGAYRANDQQAFDRACQSFMSLASSPDLSAEILYNKINAFLNAKILYILAFVLLLFTLLFASQSWWARGLKCVSYLALSAAGILHILGIVLRVIILNRPPVSNLYETFIFVSLIAVLLSIVLQFVYERKSTALRDFPLGILMATVSGALLLLVASKFAAEGDTLQVLIAVLDSNFWLSTHVICITIGYAGVALAGLVAHVYLARRYLLPLVTKQEVDKTSLQEIYSSIWGVLAFGLCFSFLGTMLGGIWADQSWGRFWGWDPKENGALLIVLWSTALLHARLSGMVRERGFAIGAVLGTIVVMISWFGINLLGVGLHSYGFTSGLATGLLSYFALELLFVLLVLYCSKTGGACSDNKQG